MSTSAERTVLVANENRAIFISRGTTKEQKKLNVRIIYE